MFGIIFEGNRDLRRIYMPADYVSFPLRKDFLLPDDAARSPGEGFRHMEQTHQPGENLRQPVLRNANLGPGPQPEGARADRRRHGDNGHDDARAQARPLARRSGHLRRDAGDHLRRGPAVPATQRARGRVLPPRRRRDARQPRAAAPLDARRAARRHQDRRRAGGRPRPGARLPAPRRREDLRERRLAPRDQQLRPARVHRVDVQRGDAGAGRREAARPAGAAPRRVHPRPRLGAQPHLQPRPVHRLAGARPGRPDADPVGLHRARRDRGDARRADRPAAAVQLPAHRRRQPRPQPRLPVAPRRLDEPGRQPARAADADPQRERDLRPPHGRAWACSIATRRCGCA